MALWQFLDKELTALAKKPEEFEKKLLPYLAQLVHNDATIEKVKETMETYMEK